ncbi:MAG: TadE/TadG family type IV pilus assembly protein [Candidatus Dormibacteria bacterium]
MVKRREGRRGQAMVEFSLVASLLLLLGLGVVDFGLLFENRLAITNGARDGVRYAATHPTSWSNADPAPSNTIEGQVQGAGGTQIVPNDDQHITITYLVPGGGTPVACGHYSAASNSFVAAAGYTQATCVVPGSLIQVSLTYTYRMTTPVMANLFPNGVSDSATAAMIEEQ